MLINLLLIIILSFFTSEGARADPLVPALGREVSTSRATTTLSVIFPDGRGLPAGHGTVSAGARLYAQRCVACHGQAGRGGPGGELAGGNPNLRADQPDQNIGTYWPYATTLYDFIRRAMPMDAPWSLSDDETYALVAYLLHLNGIVGPDTELDAHSLAQVRMPNREGFDPIEGPTAVTTLQR